jgi:hypothetical protein
LNYKSIYKEQPPVVTNKYLKTLEATLNSARARGEHDLTIDAGEFARTFGNYPEVNQVPIICSAMTRVRNLPFVASSRILNAPPKGKGASLTIWFELIQDGSPRNQARNAIGETTR